MSSKSVKGRGAQSQPANRFLAQAFTQTYWEGIDEVLPLDTQTVYLQEHAKNIVNAVKSSDIGHGYSMNPYQGCEHGCVYCYARNTHEYYGYSAGIDFESKIIVKQNAAELLEKAFQKKDWKPAPIMLAGNTDCYQPAERTYRITRQILEVCAAYHHPVSVITKNALITRDLDVLQQLASEQLVHVSISITSCDEKLRLQLEPRTATIKKRLETIQTLRSANIPVRVMAAPMIPFLNSHELPAILEAAAQAGAQDAGYIMVRLNGAIGPLFTEWIQQTFPEKADRVLAQIKAVHGGQLNDHRMGVRMKGEGPMAEMMARLFATARKKYFQNQTLPPYNIGVFRRPERGQLSLF